MQWRNESKTFRKTQLKTPFHYRFQAAVVTICTRDYGISKIWYKKSIKGKKIQSMCSEVAFSFLKKFNLKIIMRTSLHS